MYEYYNYSDNNGQKLDTPATKEQLKAKKKAERKEAGKKTWKKIGTSAILGLTFGALAAGSFQCINRVTNYFFPTEVKEAVVDENQADEVKTPVEIQSNNTLLKDAEKGIATSQKDGGLDVSDVARNAMPSIVSITNKSVQQVRSMWGMGIQEYENTSVGSGIIIGKNDDELLIVTNNHVIEGASSLTVGFVDDEIYDAYSKGTEADRDLAVIAVKLDSLSDDTKSKISIATMGTSEDLEVGEQVVAIGNALGYGQSVTTGIVSALDREVTIDNVTNNLIQTDAAINPGNSGGALLNMNGELIGINSAKFASSSVEGMGYAIPIDTVEPIVEGLMNRETRDLLNDSEAGYLGITGLNVDSTVSYTYGIPEGVYLQEVSEGSPAEKAGLIKGDVIKKFDGTSVTSISDLKNTLLYYKPGEQIEVVYYRADNGQYEEKTTTVTLGDRKGTALDTENSSEDTDEKDENADSGKNDKDGSEPDGSNDDNPSGFEGGFHGEIEIPSDIGSLFGEFFNRN